MTIDPLADLSRALDATAAVAAGVAADQWGSPSPCEEWTVGEVFDHLVAGNERFARAARGEAMVDPPPAGSVDASDRVGAYRRASADLLGAFGEPGALERTMTVPFGTVPGMVALNLRITEVLVHGWDLAVATGQAASFPDDVAERELAFTLAALPNVKPERRPFAPPQPFAEDAPAIDRLAACLGRTVPAVPG